MGMVSWIIAGLLVGWLFGMVAKGGDYGWYIG